MIITRDVARRSVVAAAALLGAAGLAATATVPARAAGHITAGRPAASAVAAKTPGWRLAARIGPDGSTGQAQFAVSSATDAWANLILSGVTTALERWDGSKWRVVAVPTKLEENLVNTVAFGASSGSDFWLFGPYPRTKALHYTGTKWAIVTIPSWVLQRTKGGAMAADVSVFSPSDVWLFNYGVGRYAAHWNGRAWERVRLPAVPVGFSFSRDETATGPGDIWVTAADGLMHWDGRRWTLVRFPALPLAKGVTASYQDLTALSGSSVWMIRFISSQASAVHWNGKTWSAVAAPVAFGDAVAPDGHGGVWLTGASPVATPGGDFPGKWRFFHFSGGHWTSTPMPPGIDPYSGPGLLNLIPGTSSLWTTASWRNAKGQFGSAILKYGK